MPRVVPPEVLDKLARIIARSPEGIGIDALSRSLKPRLPRRTLQRRLFALVEARRILTEGKGRAIRYRIAPNIGEMQTTLPVTEVEAEEFDEFESFSEALPIAALEAYVPITAESEDIRAYIRQPLQKRRPVGYDRTLLENYRPNTTLYLPQAIRDHLHNIGHPMDGKRPAGTYAKNILNRLLIDLSWASSRLEGNTYSRLDTQNLIERGQEAEGKDRRETQMILNHKAAIELLVDQASGVGFDTFTFLNLHALLSENLLADPSEGGRLRRRIVDVTGTVFHPLGIPQQIDDYFRSILKKTDAVDDPFEQAFFIMVHIPYLQPFVDVNKRVSRLGANVSLIKHNLCPLSFVDVPEQAYIDGTLGVYELQKVELLRDVFIWAYERSCQRYQVIRETTAAPDPLRLRHRKALTAVIGKIVRQRQKPTSKSVRALAKPLVPRSDLRRFVEMTLAELENLYEGNVIRHGLKLSEYVAWRNSVNTESRDKTLPPSRAKRRNENVKPRSLRERAARDP